MAEIAPELRSALHGGTDALGALIAQGCPKPEGCDDWLYLDIPWVTVEVWNMLGDIIGEGQVRALAVTQRGNEARGQIWVSPEAAARLREYADRKPS